MKRYALLLPILFFTLASLALAQSFTISASPRERSLDTSTTFTIAVAPSGGFKASVFLSASCPTLPAARISFTPEYLNPPFTRTAILTVTLHGPKQNDTHDVVIEGKNGPAIARDTVRLIISERHTAWRVFNRMNTPIPYYGAVNTAVDHERGLAWIGTRDSLYSFDGMSWSAEAWPFPDSAYVMSLQGVTVDSSGGVWALFEGVPGMIFHRTDSSWKVYYRPDSASGLSSAIISSLHWTNPRAGSSIQSDAAGNIWLLGGGSVSRFDGMQWYHYDESNSPLGDRELLSFMLDRRGNLWVGGYDRMMKFDGTYWTKYLLEDLHLSSSSYMSPLAADTTNHLWIRTGNGMVEFDGDTAIPSTAEWLPLGRTLTFDDKNHAWVGTGDRGLARHDGTQWWNYTATNSGIYDNRITSIDIDRARTVWITTYGGDLVLLDGNASPPSAFLLAVPSDNEATAALDVAPNPLSGVAMVHVATSGRGACRVRLFDALGCEAARLFDGAMEPGEHTLRLEGAALPSGVYFLRLDADGAASRIERVVIAH